MQTRCRPLRVKPLPKCLPALALAWLAAGCAPGHPSSAMYVGYGVPMAYHGMAYRGYGGAAVWDHGAGYAHGAYGGAAVWGHGAGYAHGAYGGSAEWDHGAGYATGPHGDTAAWNHGTGYVSGSRGTMAFHR
jgi:hypothetical protein